MGLLKGLQHPWLIWVLMYKKLYTGEITPEESFTNAYVEEVYGSEHFRTATKILHVILYAKYEKADLHKVMETQCQHLKIAQRYQFSRLSSPL